MIVQKLHGRIYYGWVIVAVMSITGATIIGLSTINFGLFIKPMSEELGISRASFGAAQSLRPPPGHWSSRSVSAQSTDVRPVLREV